MHTDSGMTGISLSGYMPYMTVASLEMSDEPKFFHVIRFRLDNTKLAIELPPRAKSLAIKSIT